jgi:hypothetical protein
MTNTPQDTGSYDVVMVACRTIADLLNPLPARRQKQIVARLIELYGTPEHPSARERAIFQKPRRRRRGGKSYKGF